MKLKALLCLLSLVEYILFMILYVENDALISLLKEKEENITASDIKKERLKAAKRLLPRQLIFIAAGLLAGISLNFS